MENPQVDAVIQRPAVLDPVQTPVIATERMRQLQEFVATYLLESSDGGQDGGDYGVIPGTGSKKTLFKSGAEKLCDVYGLADKYHILQKTEDFATGLFDYIVECELVRKVDGMFVGTGLGSCSSYESKYRYREKRRECPECGVEAIIRGKAEYGGGWICWKKRDGCGQKFGADNVEIVSQVAGRVENVDLADHKNTVIKIAKKRAKVDAVIGATRTSGMFTQDLELTGTEQTESGTATKVEAQAQQPPSTETHAEKITRVKAEAAAKKAIAAKPASTGTAGGTSAVQEVKPAASKPVASDGQVDITGINIKNGPMIMKDGVSMPAWGPLYIITFSAKVRASDGAAVSQASTFDEAVATSAEEARNTNSKVHLVIEPGAKKGSYGLKGLHMAPSAAAEKAS